MKVVICSSLSFPQQIIKVKEELEAKGHKVFIPPLTKEYLKGKRVKGVLEEDVKAKKELDALKLYFKEIKKSNALLVLNYSKKGIKNYIGANALIEMAFAHVLNKKIYLLNPIPEMDSKSEVIHMNPIILDSNIYL